MCIKMYTQVDSCFEPRIRKKREKVMEIGLVVNNYCHVFKAYKETGTCIYESNKEGFIPKTGDRSV